MALILKPKPTPKEVKASIPEPLMNIFDKYVRDSMKKSGYPDTAVQDAKDQVFVVALAKLISNDREFISSNPTDAATVRTFLPAKNKPGENSETP